MRAYEVDFTSAPSRCKPIRVAACWLERDRLHFERLERIGSLGAFEASLAVRGPWVAGFDVPFIQSRRFLRNIGGPKEWGAFADLLESLDQAAFRVALEAYKANRALGTGSIAVAMKSAPGP